MARQTRSQSTQSTPAKKSPNSSAMPASSSQSQSVGHEGLRHRKAPTHSTSKQSRSYDGQPCRQTLVLIGLGFGNHTLLRHLLAAKSCSYNIVVLAPTVTTALTPLLASAACGLVPMSSAEEPVRRYGWGGERSGHEYPRSRKKVSPLITAYQATASSIDFDSKTVHCKPFFPDASLAGSYVNDREFEISYDALVIGAGMVPNDFGTPGVQEHTLALQSVQDATALRARILENLEAATLPPEILTDRQRSALTHIAVVGAGPSGVEVAAELDEMLTEHLAHVYPAHVMQQVKLSVWDVKDKILAGTVSNDAQAYAQDRLEKRQGVELRLGRTLKKTGPGWIESEEDGRVDVGCVIWAVGGKPGVFVEELACGKVKGRIATDGWLRVLRDDPPETDEKGRKGSAEATANDTTPAVHEDVYALGDAADIFTSSLPPTAEVAVQKATYLAQQLLSQGNSIVTPLTFFSRVPNPAAYTTPPSSSSASSSPAAEPGHHGRHPSSAPFTFRPLSKKAYLGRRDGVLDRGGKPDDASNSTSSTLPTMPTMPTWHAGVPAWLAWRKGNLDWCFGWRRRLAVVLHWALVWLEGRDVARK